MSKVVNEFKKIGWLLLLGIATYHLVAAAFLYTSSLNNLIGYYAGGLIFGKEEGIKVEVVALPFVGGEALAGYTLLHLRDQEVKETILQNQADLASIIISFEHSNHPAKVALSRSMEVAQLFVRNGYDIQNCMYDEKTAAKFLFENGYFGIQAIDTFFKKLEKQGHDIFQCTSQ